jgi:single-stranded-DNA-specific exonuclease
VQILARNSFKDKNFILADNEHWPAGILGLIAGKIADEFQRPTAIFRLEGDVCTGSFRSIESVDIMEVLLECSDLLLKFGGHSQAAGVSIKKENLENLYNRMLAAIDKRMSGEKITPSISIDLEVKVEDIDWEFMLELKRMEPFGNGNPEPIFLMRDINILDIKVCGNGTKHLKLALRSNSGSPKIFDSIGFGLAEKFSNLNVNDNIDIVFSLAEDEWNGNKKIQLKILDLKKHEG